MVLYGYTVIPSIYNVKNIYTMYVQFTHHVRTMFIPLVVS